MSTAKNRKPVSSKTRFDVFKRDGFACQYCGRKTPQVILELEHIVPVAEGGTNEIANLTTACFECNRGKGATPLSELPESLNLHQQTIILAEREIQLREYNEMKRRAREREDDEICDLQEFWRDLYKRDSSGLWENVLRGYLQIFAKEDIIECMQLAYSRLPRDISGGRAYLVGILKRRAIESGARTPEEGGR